MKVLLWNGSTRKEGCTYRALCEVASALNQDGIETEILQLGNSAVLDCCGCDYCQNSGNQRCVHTDIANEWLEKAAEADGFVFGSPVYYSHPAGQFLSVLDRMFYAGSALFRFKPGAAVVAARRAGTTASLDVLNKHITDANMLLVSSTYWNMVHGNTPEEVEQDREGLQTMRNLGHHMAWVLKCLDAGRRQGIESPVPETAEWTNFIR